ncbi:MAG: hypothetical protein V7L20_04430 [Nostoc sp.]
MATFVSSDLLLVIQIEILVKQHGEALTVLAVSVDSKVLNP